MAARVLCVRATREGLHRFLTQVPKKAPVRRNLGTSQKKQEASTEKVGEGPENKRNWASYGFDSKHKATDRFLAHTTTFLTVTLLFVVGSFIHAYKPARMEKDWAQREAYLELRRREELGLPLIDPNLIDPAKIKLPTDEELGDMEIII